MDLSKVVVFDVETTGLDPLVDEVLQLSMIDGNGNILFSSLIRPYFSKSWEDAQEIHGISPYSVESAPYPHEVRDEVKRIFDNAEMLVAYNGKFDKNFLAKWHIRFDKPYSDVMLEFAPIFGEMNEKYGGYKWQKLVTCAGYYNYEFKAHDALEDVRATLHCWKSMHPEVLEGDYFGC